MWMAIVCYMAFAGWDLQPNSWVLGMLSPGLNGAICIIGSLAIEAFLFNFDGLHRYTTQLLRGESTLELLHYIPD